MARHNESSARTQLRADILAILASGETLTANEIDERLSFGDSHEVARVLYDMRVKQGLITCGLPVDKGGNARKTYRIVTPTVCAGAHQDIDSALITALREVDAELPKGRPFQFEETSMSETPIVYAHIGTAPEDDPGPEDCPDHAALSDALGRDEEAERLEEVRSDLVDSLLIYAHWTLRDDPVWKSMTRAYRAAAGATLEACHG